MCCAYRCICREADGLCDLEETCNGTSAQCPPDSLRPYGFICRCGGSTLAAAEATSAHVCCRRIVSGVHVQKSPNDCWHCPYFWHMRLCCCRCVCTHTLLLTHNLGCAGTLVLATERQFVLVTGPIALTQPSLTSITAPGRCLWLSTVGGLCRYESRVQRVMCLGTAGPELLGRASLVRLMFPLLLCFCRRPSKAISPPMASEHEPQQQHQPHDDEHEQYDTYQQYPWLRPHAHAMWDTTAPHNQHNNKASTSATGAASKRPGYKHRRDGPHDDKDWPECRGFCLYGKFVQPWDDRPRCCFVRPEGKGSRQQHGVTVMSAPGGPSSYALAEDSAQEVASVQHWRTHSELYCWDDD